MPKKTLRILAPLLLFFFLVGALSWLLFTWSPSVAHYVPNFLSSFSIKKSPASFSPGSYKVSRVIDGDTVDVVMSGSVVRLRLIGIDTPEVVDPRKPVQCFGKEASKEASRLLEGKTVRLKSDASQGQLDKYGRSLVYLYLPDGTFFNQLMIEEGYAHEYTYRAPYRFQADFKNAEANARIRERGLWAPDACR